MSLQSGNNLTVIASQLAAGEDLSLMGAGDISLLAERDSDYRYRYAEDDEWYGSKIKTETAYDETARVVELTAGGNVQINALADKKTGKVITSNAAKGNVFLEGTQIQSGGDSLIYAGEDLYITAAREQRYQHSETRREYSGWVNDAAGAAGTLASFAGVGAIVANGGQGISFDLAGSNAKGQTQQRLVDATFSGPGTSLLLAGEGVTLEAGDYRGDNLMMSSGLNEDSIASTQILGLQTHNTAYAEESTYRFGQTQGFGSLSTQSEETRSQQQSITRWHGTRIDITNDVDIHSAGDLVVQGAHLTAGGDANVSAVGGIYFVAGQSATSHSDAVSSDANLGEYTEEQRNSSTVRAEVTSINAGGDVNMHSLGDQVYQGSVITNDGDQTYTSEAGSVSFLAVTDTRQTSHTEQSSDFSWVTMKSEGSLDETARMVSLQPGGELIINAANGINVDLRQINSQTGPALVATLVEQNPEMAWLQQLSDQGDINWHEVQEVHERWSDESASIGGGAAAVIAIVVTVLTAGVGTGIVGALGATTTATATTAVSGYTLAAAAATQAVVTSAATQVTLATINNGGKLDRSLSDLGQKDSLRGLGASALTAGLTVGVDKLFENWTWGREGLVKTDPTYSITKGFDLDDWKGMAGFATHNATNGLVSAAVNDAIYGGHFSDYLRSSMESQGNDVLSALAFNQLGTLTTNLSASTELSGHTGLAQALDEGGSLRVVGHAIVGGGISEITGGDFGTGASAGAASALVTPYLKGFGEAAEANLRGPAGAWSNAGAELAGVFGAALAGGDVSEGQWIANQGYNYNAKIHERGAALLDAARDKVSELPISDAEKAQKVNRLVALACAARNCSSGVPDGEVLLKRQLQALEQQGATLIAMGTTLETELDALGLSRQVITRTGRRKQLIGSTDAFRYSLFNTIEDAASRNTGVGLDLIGYGVERTYFAASAGTVNGIAGAANGLAEFSWSEDLQGFGDYMYEQMDASFAEEFAPHSGQSVIDSFSMRTYADSTTYSAELGLLAAELIPIGKLIKSGDRLYDAVDDIHDMSRALDTKLFKDSVASDGYLYDMPWGRSDDYAVRFEQSLEAFGDSRNIDATSRPDFYVSPDGGVLPATGYRYSDSNYADSIIENQASPATPGGHYIGFEKLDSASDVQNRYQISPDWSDAKVRGEFDTLQLYSNETGKWNANIPTTRGNTTDIPEPYTSSYPEYGSGDAQQYITNPNTPLKYNDVEILGE